MILLLLASLLFISGAEVIDCNDFKGLSSEDVKKEFDYARARDASLGEKQTRILPISCGLFLLKNDLIDLLEMHIYSEYIGKSKEISPELESEISKRASSLTRIKEVISLHSRKRNPSELSTIVPAFRWAQSLSHIFIEVKFAHRFDSPGSNEMLEPDVEFQEKSLKLKAQTDKAKGIDNNFELNLDFLNEIDPQVSTWELNSVGRVFLKVAKKEQPSRWKRLLTDSAHRQLKSRMSLWIEMYDKYHEEVDRYEPQEAEFSVPFDDKPDYKKHPAEEAAEKRREEAQKRREEAEKRREEAARKREQNRIKREEDRKRREEQRNRREEQRRKRFEEKMQKDDL